ncbi:MAG: Fe-S cluster assembly ATPase SufC [Bacilli bacterium]|nr:Fe-S cluster assembly ATPase SufC [Erysipelotrichaceae bacterium]MDD7381275.1 Fe-S cluster assembly ATPase SufC [Bacillales bacterium]MDY2746956.1 Fe-S cluster assembly ATPase SufC [Bacilli bacterium]MDY3890410.1 Fe-S cluster assembly ATPase SufC [Bacilli bacterium]MDY5892220.1 Fe-S cluster assembly ATPase SufC [Candidatus Onthovivens sp.]
MKELIIKDLHVSVEDKEILKGVNLTINANETIALLGPNGHGKSTLLAAIMGNPKYKVTQGSITLDGEDVLAMKVDERARKGVFLAMQYPSEVPGVVNADFLKAAINARRENPIKLFEFYRSLESASKKMHISMDMAQRFLNEGFSGGEKKRNEILQMLLFNPDLSMLDEIDSGLDVDALVCVSDAIKECQQKGMSFLVISHYARLYQLIQPTRVAVMINGKIAVEGGKEIIDRIDTQGYEWIKYELGIEIEKEDNSMNKTSIGVCATREATKGK